MSAFSDRELLELAAKAAGNGAVRVDTEYAHCFKVPYETVDIKGWRHWNPLTDDGDALRLAVKLDMLVDFSSSEGWIDIMHPGERIKEVYAGDPMAAVRRAIVRAAAGIGKAMP